MEVDENELKDVLIEIPVEVTENAPENYQAPIFKKEEVKYVPRLSEEPRVRVGIKAPAEYLQFSSNGDDYLVFAGSKKMGVLPKKKLGIFEFKNEQYSFRGGDLSFDSDTYIHLEPENNESAVFTLHNLKRYASWLSSASFNKYRGAVEYRQGQVDKQMYAVNDLLMEDYVKGIAENSSRAPDEFVKANLVAARNYAYYSREKYPFFDVLGSTYDQLYLGCLAEDILPNVVKAAKATRGVMVLYDDEIVTTPYFGNSNGWTRSWPSVWGGTKKPWLVPVRAGYDAGRSQFGHGVGMSQRDAAYRAEKEGLGFDELLKYYYTGVEVEQIYL